MQRQKISGFPMRRDLLSPLSPQRKIKTLFIGNPDSFCICLIKCLSKVSYIFKIHILLFMTLTLFASILGDSVQLSKCAQKW